MRTCHPPDYDVGQTLLLAACLSPILLGCIDFDFDGSNEAIGQTYKQYVAERGNAWFDPKGASAISQRTSSTRDGYDAWWRFTVSETDFLSIVTAVANEEHGPPEVQLTSSADPPSHWSAESVVPDWWVIQTGAKPQSIYWCFKVGSAERRHGWFFVYDPDTDTVWCWHWNHQWSSSECP